MPSLLEHVRVKDNSEIFRVVAFNLANHTADLIRPGRDVIYHDVPRAMLDFFGVGGPLPRMVLLVEVCFLVEQSAGSPLIMGK